MRSLGKFSKAENEVGSLTGEPRLALGDHWLPLPGVTHTCLVRAFGRRWLHCDFRNQRILANQNYPWQSLLVSQQAWSLFYMQSSFPILHSLLWTRSCSPSLLERTVLESWKRAQIKLFLIHTSLKKSLYIWSWVSFLQLHSEGEPYRESGTGQW